MMLALAAKPRHAVSMSSRVHLWKYFCVFSELGPLRGHLEQRPPEAYEVSLIRDPWLSS